MHPKLSEVTSEADFDAIMPVLFRAFHSPYNSFSKFFNPIHTTLEAAIQDSKARQVAMWKGNQDCHWLKVTDAESGDVIGAACWEVNATGYDKGGGSKKAFNASWHIEGSEEKLWAEKLIGGLKGFLKEKMTRPHLELDQLIVDPEHRRKGIGRMLINWGVKKADEMGVETVIESVPYAVPAYEHCGFECVEEVPLDFAIPNPSEKWEEWQREDHRAYLMWRPVGKDYGEGDKTPWEKSG
ncbi:acyl-CoA N-acyltransferase [Mytilinidion resinicola]|uniref:Acyl-CoA N-acyltransferase n=1 Tax=Mytilinidion resinicola TaxID=574789 RepID=A0A6A6Z3W3_9PEZI|nr:acyl-CoA N-acyltransferase [Mytilinidion resinicola]KAF2815720.1 acyl-CoA N-acyltransferase [Mytilinidion resinicola]